MALILPPEQMQEPSDCELIKRSNTQFLKICKHNCIGSFAQMWKKRDQRGQLVNKTKEEAQAVLNDFGVDAAKAFQAHAKLQEIIALVDPSWVPLIPPYAYVVNNDGSVTLS